MTPVGLDEASQPRRSSRPSSARGRVVMAPGGPDDPLYVVLINFSGNYSYEVPAGQWMGRGATLPEVGNQCLVIFDDDGDAWVPAWVAS